jgi:hypothetical protein
MKDLLKAVSPVAALLGGGKDAGFAMGIIPGLLRRKYVEDKAEEERQAAIAASAQGKPMKKGGMTASSRADGCATKGKTRGKMV